MQVNLEASPLVQQVCAFFRDREVPAWLVGGFVRDALLGRPTNDVDVAVETDGLRWARELADALDGAFVPLDPEHDTGRVVVREAKGVTYVDVAAFRAPTLEEDLRARDFTVNALAADVRTGEVVDATGGLADLNRFRLRVIRPSTFQQDPVRLLRAVRLAVSLSFTLEPETEARVRAEAGLLTRAAAERVLIELIKMLEGNTLAALLLMDDLRLLPFVLPELAACQGKEQPPPHTLDVYGHTLEALAKLEHLWPWRSGPDEAWAERFWGRPLGRHRQPLTRYLEERVTFALSRRELLKLAVLLHDVGKPPTRSVDERGRIHFYRHEHVGARLAAERLRALRFPERAVRWVERIVRHHMRPFHLSRSSRPSRRALYRYFRDTGDAAPAIALHSVADHLAKGGAHALDDLRRVAHRVWDAYFRPDELLVNPRPLLDGHALQRLGIPPGPELGRLLERLKEAQAVGAVRTVEEAEQYVRRVWATWHSGNAKETTEKQQ